MEHDERSAMQTYADAAAAIVGISLEAADRAVVVAILERLAGYAADIASVDLPRDGDA